MIEQFSKNKSKLSAIYQNLSKNTKEDRTVIRTEVFPIYQSGQSMCFKPNKPISKMMDYEKFSL